MERRKRLLAEVQKLGLDGVLISSPENIFYATGLSPHQLTVSRCPSFASALFRADDAAGMLCTMDYEAPALALRAQDVEIVPYATWVGVKSEQEWREKRDAPGGALPGADETLKGMFKKLRLSAGRVGAELQFLPAAAFDALRRLLPDVEWTDVSDAFLRARAVKTPAEIAIYRRLTEVCDSALLEMSHSIAVGARESDLIRIYRKACIADDIFPSAWSMLGAGPNSSMLTLPSDRRIEDGDALRFDGGCEAGFAFYKTDFSRGWLIGHVDPALTEMKKVLVDAQREMIARLRPGMAFSDLFHTGYDYVKRYLPNYRRGHQGHSISLGPQTADAPLVAPSQEGEVQPGMVLAIEIPFYIRGYNGFNIEDMVLVGESSAEVLTHRTPHYLDSERR